MPRDKKTEPVDFMGDLPDLTPNEAEFVRHLLEGRSATAAYRAAYKPEGWLDKSVSSSGSRLRMKPSIQAWLNAGRLAGLEQYSEDFGQAKLQHVQRMQELATKAELSGNYGAAVQAQKAVGQVLGLYIERHEDVTRQQQNPSDVIEAIQELLGSEAARKAAIRLGVEAPQTTIDSVTVDNESSPKLLN